MSDFFSNTPPQARNISQTTSNTLKHIMFVTYVEFARYKCILLLLLLLFDTHMFEDRTVKR